MVGPKIGMVKMVRAKMGMETDHFPLPNKMEIGKMSII